MADLDQDVYFLFDEQIILDEGLLNLEETNDQVVVELAEVNANIQGRKLNNTLSIGSRIWGPKREDCLVGICQGMYLLLHHPNLVKKLTVTVNNFYF